MVSRGGCGHGRILNTAAGMGAISHLIAQVADFQKQNWTGHQFSGDPVLFNQYAYLPLIPNAAGKT